MLDDVAADLCEPGEDRGEIGEARLDLVDKVIDDELGDFAIERLQALTRLAEPQRELPHRRLQFVLQALDDGLQARLFLRRQLLELRGVHRLALLVHRRERETRRRADQQHALLRGTLAQGRDRLLLPLLELRLDVLLAPPVLLASERRRQRRLEVFDETRHRVGERAAPTGRQAQRTRRLLVLEVVDVDPVVRCRLLGRERADEVEDARLATGAGLAGDEDVVAVGAHRAGHRILEAPPQRLVDGQHVVHAAHAAQPLGRRLPRLVRSIHAGRQLHPAPSRTAPEASSARVWPAPA